MDLFKSGGDDGSNNELTSIWLRGEFLLRCVLPLNPPSGLNTYNLKRMIAYLKIRLKNKAKNDDQPQLLTVTFNEWQHVACKKWGLPQDLAITYFCLMVDIEQNSLDTRQIRDQIFSANNNEDDPTNVVSHWSKIAVPLLPFVLLLFLQQANRRNMRDSMKIPDRFPGCSKDDSFMSFASSFKENLENCALSFIQQNVRSLLELVMLSEETNIKDYRKPEIAKDTINFESLKALNYLFEGIFNNTVDVSDKNKLISPFTDFVETYLLSKNNERKEIFHRLLETFLKTYLKNDPFFVASPNQICTTFCADNSFNHGDHLKTANDMQVKKSKILHNEASPYTHRIVLFSNFVRSTVIKGNEILHNSVAHVMNCRDSHLYIMAPVKCLIIRKCYESTIVSAPVTEILRLHYCRDVKIVAVCRRLVVLDCRNCTIHVRTPTPPLIFGSSNEDITLAPFHTSYPSLESQMIENKFFPTSANMWNKPLCFYNSDNNENIKRSVKSWSLMDADKFFLFYLPFTISGVPADSDMQIPGGLPDEYKLAIEKRRQALSGWQKLVTDIDPQSKLQLESIMHEKFMSWLEKEGKKNELDQLRKLQINQRSNGGGSSRKSSRKI